MAGTITRLRQRRSDRPEPAGVTVRSTADGDVIGLVAENGCHVWRGIPFAASTAGRNRWRAPQPVEGWSGTKEAVTFAPRCAQLTNPGDRDEGLKPGLVVGSENCLALDIYAPPVAAGNTLPVMVWIHGGGNVWGRSSLYDGSRLAVNENVIVVAVQFRVGPLGWFAHPALREAAENPEDRAACFATLDLIAGLRWVADNIGSFGGDPDCVTIFGESSGGHNVATLLASPMAAGLFHRAIIQSGSFDSVSLAEAEGRAGQLENPSSAIAERLGVSTAEELRDVSVEDLYRACDQGSGWFLDVPRVIEDGVVLPSTPLRQAFESTDTFNAVPIITGTNRDEMKLFYMGDERMTEKRLGLFVVPRNQPFYDAMAEYISRIWRLRSVNQPAAAMANAGHNEVYSYRFDWDDGGRLLSMDFGQLLGAAHGLEIPFVFNRFHHLGDADRFLFTKSGTRDRDRLSLAMGRYWAAFARDGKPSCPGQPHWPQQRTNGGTYLRLDTNNDGGIVAVNDLDTLDRLADELRTDGRINGGERQAIVDEMERWMFTRPVRSKLGTAVLATDGDGPKGAIFYSTRYGSTAQYADWISEATGLPAYSITDPFADPDRYDFLVLGSPVIYYKLTIRHWAKANANHIRNKPTMLFTVSGAPAGITLDGWLADSLPDSLLSNVEHIALRGRWSPGDLTVRDRLGLFIGAMFNRDREARRDELRGFDYMDKSSIAPIVDQVMVWSTAEPETQATTAAEMEAEGPAVEPAQNRRTVTT